MGEQRSGEDSTLGFGDLERFLGGSVICFIRRRPGGWGKAGDVVLPQHPVPLSLGFQLLHQEVRLCRELLGSPLAWQLPSQKEWCKEQDGSECSLIFD